MTAWIQLPPDTVVGEDYRLGELLGAGGMGAVYVAEQLSTGKRRALKLMHPQLVEDPRQRKRFAQEARVSSLIASEHVVEVIGAGVDEPTGLPWIAMELLQGENLAHALQRTGPVGGPVLCGWFRQLGDALDAAHGAGVVHRDIKPENIFLASSRGAAASGVIKVLDFGIAKVVAATQATATALLGSPAWMAPEQTDPGAPITPLTDLWPLGLLAFWLLTGQLFWRAAADPNASMHSVLKEILFDAIPRPSRRAAELGCATRLPAGFDDWFDRCVHREPRARFPSAGELVRALEALVDGEARASAVPAEPIRPAPAAVPAEVGSVAAEGALATDAFVADAGLELATEPATRAETGAAAGPELATEPAAQASTGPHADTGPEVASTVRDSSPPARSPSRVRRWGYRVGAPLLVGLTAAGIWFGASRPRSDPAALVSSGEAASDGGDPPAASSAAASSSAQSVLSRALEPSTDAGADGSETSAAPTGEKVARTTKRKATDKRSVKRTKESTVPDGKTSSELDVTASTSKGSAVSGTPSGGTTASTRKKKASPPPPSSAPASTPLPTGNEDAQKGEGPTKP